MGYLSETTTSCLNSDWRIGSLGEQMPRCFTLDRFLFDRATVQPLHAPVIHAVATNIVSSQRTLQPIRSIDLVGHTDQVGSDAHNVDLGRRRAEEVRRELFRQIDRQQPGLSVQLTFTVQSRGKTQPLLGPAALSRRVEICLPMLPPPTVCGPDATDWFIRQVAAAKTDPAVLAIKGDLTRSIVAASGRGLNASAIAEGAVAVKVLAAETAAGSPVRTAAATAQLAAATPGRAALQRSISRAAVGSPFDGLLLGTLRRVATRWVSLVKTGGRYDFKNDSRTMRGPTTANCPSRPGCPDTITLCPSTGSDCFLTDVPGNLLYAHVGRFVGWTELALQLGSQFAQLDSTRSWDPPEDTRMISIGFNLPDPLTRAHLCAALTNNRSAFTTRPCVNCLDPSTAQIV